jgi:hypothetical protein
MRAHHAIAVVAVILIGLGVKLFFFSAAEADTSTVPSASVDPLQMHIDHPNVKNLPSYKLHDMTFVFSEGD